MDLHEIFTKGPQWANRYEVTLVMVVVMIGRGHGHVHHHAVGHHDGNLL